MYFLGNNLKNVIYIIGRVLMKSTKEKINVKKWTSYALILPITSQLDMRAHFYSHSFLSFFGTCLVILGRGQKDSDEKKSNLIKLFQPLKKFGFSDNLNILQLTHFFYIFFKFWPKNHPWAKFDLKHLFYIWGPWEKCFPCNVSGVLKQFYGAHNKFGSMTITRSLGQLRPNWFNYWIKPNNQIVCIIS